MLLWDIEIGARKDEVDRIPGREKWEIALDQVQRVADLLNERQENVFSPQARELVSGTVNQWRSNPDSSADARFFEDLFDIREREGFASASMLMALSDIVDVGRDGMSTDVLLRILSACYEALLNTEDLGRNFTPDDERTRSGLLREIAAQKDALGLD